MSVHITRADVDQLVHEPSAAVRAHIAEKVCVGYHHEEYSDKENQIAEDIFRLLLEDTEVRVRKVLADQLKTTPHVPRDVVIMLANDHDMVACEVLEYSPVLTEQDLMNLVEATHNLKKLKAIAERNTLSIPVSDALIKTGEMQVTKTVLKNRGAHIGNETYDYLLEEYNMDNSVMEELVYRGGLPYETAEKLFSLVSDKLKKHLTKRYRLPLHVVDDVTENARETATLQFLSPWMSQQDIEGLVDSMYKNKRLSYSVVIRSLCIGDLRFFETAMAKLVGVPVSNARILLMDPGDLGFEAFYNASPMPESFLQSVKLLYRLASEETSFGRYQRYDFAQRMIDRITAEGYDKKIENISYLLSILGRSTKDVPTLH